MTDSAKHPLLGAQLARRSLADTHATKICAHFGNKLLRPGHVAPHEAIFVIFTNRSGSTYFGDLLHTSGLCNPAGEPLNWDHAVKQAKLHNYEYFSQVLDQLCTQAVDGRIALKASLWQYDFLRRTGMLQAYFPNHHIVVVERLNKIAQAVSWMIASQTGAWTSRQKPGLPLQDVEYREDVIYDFLQSAYVTHHNIDLYFTLRQQNFCKVIYEDLLATPHAVMHRVFRFIGAPPDAKCDLAKVRLKRQESPLNGTFVQRFIVSQSAMLSPPHDPADGGYAEPQPT